MSHFKLDRTQQKIVSAVNDCWAPLARLNDKGLADFVEAIREKAIARPHLVPELVPSIISVAKEAIRRQLGWELYDVQILASHALINGNIAEMQTGEGKTIAAVPAAVFGGIQSRGTHIATPTPYLAGRDYQQLKPVFECLGLSVGLLEEESSQQASSKQQAYACDITYGPGYEFGFDYLRDQTVLKQIEEAPLGQQILLDLSDGDRNPGTNHSRGQFYSIVDEADNVLIDDASSPLVLSEYQHGDAPDSDAVRLAMRIASTLVKDEHYRDTSPMSVELTESGRQLIHGDQIPIPVEQLARSWTTYVETALRSAHQFHLDVHYVIANDQVKIVDGTTGRIFDDRSWQAGLHQAIECKHGLAITPEKLPLAQISRQRFFRLYKKLAGMTGTATQCKSELKSVYDLDVTLIPLRLPSQRKILPMRAFESADQKWEAIANSVFKMHQQQRPVLIGCRTITESEIVASHLSAKGLNFQLLNGKQDSDEAEIIAIAGQRGAITIATNLAGRGTDIKLGSGVEDIGGLHVVVSECHESQRIDRQLIGRCARQGNPGSAQFFVSASDWLFATHGQWLGSTIGRLAVNGEVDLNLESNVRKIQNAVERVRFAGRLELLRQSERESLLFQRNL